jgi:hypothetical protein
VLQSYAAGSANTFRTHRAQILEEITAEYATVHLLISLAGENVELGLFFDPNVGNSFESFGTAHFLTGTSSAAHNVFFLTWHTTLPRILQ